MNLKIDIIQKERSSIDFVFDKLSHLIPKEYDFEVGLIQELAKHLHCDEIQKASADGYKIGAFIGEIEGFDMEDESYKYGRQYYKSKFEKND
jgi:hypothetical protein